MAFCIKCGTQLPDGAAFCFKCGSQQSAGPAPPSPQVTAPPTATVLKCSSCGAPITPKFGEMVIACEYCGTSITLGSEGWKNIQKHTMLPVKVHDKDQVSSIIHDMMDKGIFRHHLQEKSTLEEMTLSYIPYWIVPVSARTEVECISAGTSTAAEVGSIATTAALLAMMGGMGGPRGRGYGMGMGAGGMMGASMLGGMMGGGMMGGGGVSEKKTYQLDQNYNYPVVALKAFTQYQPHDYLFSMTERKLFDVSGLDKNIKVLNGDISEDMAKYQAKTLVDQLQSEKAHAQYHMIQQMHTEMDVSDGELLHAPIWFARYDHKGNKIVFVIDANSGAAINSIGI